MEDKIIKGTKKIEGLNLKLERVGEDLREAIINSSNKQKGLLQEYKRIQQKIKSEEEKVKELKRSQQEKENEMKRKEEEYYKKIEQEEEEVKRSIVEDRDNQLMMITKRQEKIDKKLKKLEYDREYCLQTLNVLSTELPKAEERFANAKKAGAVQELIEADQNLQHMKQEKAETDKRLSKTNARLTMAMLVKMVLNDRSIREMRETIEIYNQDAEEYGLDPVDVEELVKEQETFAQLKSIRKEQQSKYYKEKYGETVGNSLKEGSLKDNNLETIKQLDDEQRDQIELDSMQRLKEKRDNSLPVRAIKATGRGIAKTAKTIVGATISVGKFIGRNAKKLWKNIRKSTNRTLAGANKLMLDGTTKLREKLEEDAKTFEARREKLTNAIKSTIDEEKAIESGTKKDENKKVEQTQEYGEQE